jgi:hypothetical protein
VSRLTELAVSAGQQCPTGAGRADARSGSAQPPPHSAHSGFAPAPARADSPRHHRDQRKGPRWRSNAWSTAVSSCDVTNHCLATLADVDVLNSDDLATTVAQASEKLDLGRVGFQQPRRG